MSLAAIGLLSYAASWIMNYWMWQVMPTHADPESGYIIPMIVRGRTLYLSSFYHITYKVVLFGSLLIFLCSVIIDFYVDPFQRRNRQRRS